MTNKFKDWNVRVGKGKNFVLIDLMDKKRKMTSFGNSLGALLLTKEQYVQLRDFIKKNPKFEEEID